MGSFLIRPVIQGVHEEFYTRDDIGYFYPQPKNKPLLKQPLKKDIFEKVKLKHSKIELNIDKSSKTAKLLLSNLKKYPKKLLRKIK